MTLGKKNGRGRGRKQMKRRRSQSSSEEESSEPDSVTRCTCGKSHSVGLMVQCDECEVWQHCECMGLDEPDIPDQYFCELCKPENHFVTRLSSGKTKREYSSSGHEKKVPKKRMTLNSREASMSLEDVLAVRSALELYESGQRSPSPSAETKEISPSSEKHDLLAQPVMEELPVIKEQDESDSEMIAKITKPKKKQNKTTEDRRRAGSGRGRGGGKRGKPRSRTSTPQPRDFSPVDEGTPTSSQQEEPTNIGTAIFEYFTPESRASSPPARTRHPHARMTIYEMNRRAKQILEYISSIQIEMASKESAKDHLEIVKEDNNNDDTCSLSSASTIPIEREEEDSFDFGKHKDDQTSLEIMDILTRKLIKFQNRFGTKNGQFEDEGRITRSRETSNNYGHSI
ncbi:hypothetical protein G6F37_006265 [Rhizopus arrhizus]|nr:hypothetical protein G6F38_001040 [Rhizopus arrhizus]KAG1157925.1 hypothetical protein G6F37_006265 [Rhizopus arrhizus]